MKKRYLTLLICLLIGALLAGCSDAVNDESADYFYSNGISKAETTSAAMDMPEGMFEDSLSSGSDIGGYSDPEAKLVKTVRLDAQTKAYDALIPSIEEKLASLGGYIENRDSYNSLYYESDARNCAMTIRIPADRLNEFVSHVNESANVTYSSESVENITLQYVDTAARVEALETEQARLLELLENAENLSEILEIEARISDVGYELESYASQLRVMDNQVEYATVYLNIDEVAKLTPAEEPTVWSRITEGFGETIGDVVRFGKNLVVWIAVNSPWLVLLGAVAAVIVTVRKAASRRKPKKDPPKPTENQK